MLTGRQRVALVCAAAFVICWTGLAIAYFSDGAWVRGILGICIAAGFGIGYALSAARWRRT